MSNDAVLVLQCLFQTIWRLFTSWHFPGTNVTPAAFFFFLAAAGVGLTFVCRFLGIGGGITFSGGMSGVKGMQRYDARQKAAAKRNGG